MAGLTKVRVLNRYDMDGLSDELYHKSIFDVFAEAAVDTVFEETADLSDAAFVFASEYLPGQYDQRADSAAQCIQLISMGKKPEVKFARVMAFYGEISAEDEEAVKHYCINPVDSQEASMDKPESIAMAVDVPEDVSVVEGFREMDDGELRAYRSEMGFAMSEEDLQFVRQHFSEDLMRDPTVTELRVIDTYWSDHCRHTTFSTKITDIRFGDDAYSRMLKAAFDRYLAIRDEVYGERTGEKDITLMDLATIGTKYIKKLGLADDLDESEEINACSINVTAEIDGKPEEWLVMFKNETHNHPTEIEPFGGAATCLGGAIRDPLSGRVYVYQAMRVTGCADPRTSIADTLPGKLPQRKITTEAAHGYSSYGNQIGIATGKVAEVYDEDYVAKRMEVGAVIGAAPKANVVRERPAPGDVIILVGGRTGRDGCGGATGSSKEHTEESILTCGAEVQKGNPPVERNLQRLFRRSEAATLIKRCNDFGAGGVSVAIGELADSLDINLDLVPKKYEGLDGTELAISESQERMAVAVRAEDAEKFIAYAREENLEAVAVAKVTDTGSVRMYWRGACILDLKRSFLDTNGVKQKTVIEVEPGDPEAVSAGAKAPMDCLRELGNASQKGLTERFDSTIGAGSVLMPLGGKYQLSPAAGMAAKLPVTSGYTDTATLMTYGFNPAISKKSPYHGAVHAVVDSATKIVAMGGDYRKARLSFQEYFERLGEDPKRWGKPFGALLGGLTAQAELKIPAIGGKDSMSGTFMDIDVPPTLISFAVAAADANKVVSTELKRTGSTLVHVYQGVDEFGVVDFEQYRKNMERVIELADGQKLLSMNPVGAGGIFVTVCEMAAGNRIGAVIEGKQGEELCRAETGGLIIEVGEEFDAKELFGGISYEILGHTTAGEEIVIASSGERISLDDMLAAWTEPLESVFPVRAAEDDRPVETFSFTERSTASPVVKTAKPKVFIPVFPGTNCEMDSKRAFERAGGEVDLQIIANLTPEMLDESIRRMIEKIKESQIIMIPGGFSGGDEPDGSAKFITAVFRNPAVSEAVTELLEKRDGLMLGICNGFQALIKLGLVPYGKITEAGDDAPTLTYNSIGRHMSCLVNTRIASVKSPWLAGTEMGDIHTIPVSHGEGRFIASESLIAELAKNGQIATQYVDAEGKPTSDIRFNPNNSNQAIEGILSPDGRIFGKMGHSERIGGNLYRNVPGNFDQKLFESGIAYFK